MIQLVEEGCVDRKTQQELLTMKQPTLDRVLGVMRMKTAQNETAQKESKQIGIKGGFMEAVKVKRSVGGIWWKAVSQRGSRPLLRMRWNGSSDPDARKKSFKISDRWAYSRTPLCGTPLCGTPLYMGQFALERRNLLLYILCMFCVCAQLLYVGHSSIWDSWAGTEGVPFIGVRLYMIWGFNMRNGNLIKIELPMIVV